MTDYAKNLNIYQTTDADEVIEFIKEQARNPIEIQGTTVYDFSTHETDKEALNHAIQTKLERDLYMIPIQIQTASLLMQTILPNKLKRSEVLFYNPEEGEYYAYKNFLRDLPSELWNEEQEEIAKIIKE